MSKALEHFDNLFNGMFSINCFSVSPRADFEILRTILKAALVPLIKNIKDTELFVRLPNVISARSLGGLHGWLGLS